MPTAYTADIKNGIDFKSYALSCARAFGACVTLRDEPLGGDKIPESFAPDDYHLKAFEKAKAELAALAAMTPADRESGAEKAWNDAETSRLICLEDIRKQREAYEAMLVKVNEWNPPTTEHFDLKEFMRTQIEQSINFDCNGDYYKTPTVRLTGEEWFEQNLSALRRDLAYHTKEHQQEVERAEKRTAWVVALRASLTTIK